MIFTPTGQEGAYVIDLDRFEDERGFFGRSWCHREAKERGIELEWLQCNVSHNHKKGTLRGMHWQEPQFEAKLVRVTRGSILDVIVDIRPDSPSFKQVFSVELDAENRRSLFVPKGFAHGFVTLADDTEVFYQMSEYYVGEQARGFRYDDPDIGIEWPAGDKTISERDLDLPGFAR